MLLSIHDVPRDERHLLFCSRLNGRRRRPRYRARRSRGRASAEPVLSVIVADGVTPPTRGAARQLAGVA